MENTNHSISNYKHLLADIQKKAANHCKKNGRYDENLFNIGVELGRLLQSNNIEEHRLQVFADFELAEIEFKKLDKRIKNIKNIIGFFIIHALAEQVIENGSFSFDGDGDLSSCEKLDELISNKFSVQISSVSQNQHGGNFEVGVELNGQIAEILNRYEISRFVTFEIDNTTGGDYEVFNNPNDVSQIYYIGMSLDAKYTELTESQLIDLEKSLKEVQLFLLLSLDKVYSYNF